MRKCNDIVCLKGKIYMKNKISTILLIEIILGILIFVINAIMQKFDWQLRSWLLTVAFFVLHTGIIGFSIVSVLTINSKIKRYIFLFIWILICAGVFFINLMFFCIGIRADYIEKIDGQEVLTVEYSMFRGDTYEEHYNNYNFFSYKFVN